MSKSHRGTRISPLIYCSLQLQTIKRDHKKRATCYDWTGVWAHCISTGLDLQLIKGLGAMFPGSLKLLQTSQRFRLHWRKKSIFVVFVHALNVFRSVCLWIHRCSKQDLEVLMWKFCRWFLVSVWTVHCQKKMPVNVLKCSQTELTAREKEFPCDQWICVARPIPTCLTPYGAIPLKSSAHRNCTSQEYGKVLCPRYHPINSGSANDGHIRLWSEVVKEA